MKLNYLPLSGLFLGFFFSIQAQNPNFTQFYNYATYLNPAFSGVGTLYRFHTGYRQDNLGFDHALQSNVFTFDYALANSISNFGFYYFNTRSHKAAFQRQETALNYAYNLKLSHTWQVNVALQISYFNFRVDLNRLILEENEILGNTRENTLTTGAGILAYNKKWWFGLTAKNIEFGKTKQVNALPLYMSFHVGFRTDYFINREKITFEPALIFQIQNTQYQNDLGFNLIYKKIILGTWFRGFYNFKNQKLHLDAVSGLLGLQLQGFQIAYNYDFKINALGVSLAGTHEISLTFSKQRKNKKKLPCPVYR